MEDKRAHLNRGRLLGVRGKFKEAVKEYKSALEIDPNYREARTNLEIIYYLYYRRKGGRD